MPMGKKRNIRKHPRNPNLVFAALWMIFANAAVFTLWRFGFIPVSQHLFFIVMVLLGGTAVGTALIAIRRVPAR